MLRHIAVLVLGALTVQMAAGQTRPAGSMRVLTYNIRQGNGQQQIQLGGWTIPLPFGRKLKVPGTVLPVARPGQIATIADDLKAYDADVIFLQEVNTHSLMSLGRDQAEQIADRMGMHHAYAVAQRDAVVVKQQGNAILSKHPISDARSVELNPAGDGEERRVAVVAKIDQPGVPGGVYAVCVHIAVHSETMKERDMAALLALITSLPGPVILSGDFNQSPTAAPITQLLANLTAAGHELHDAFKDVGTGDGGTSSAPKGEHRIDYVLTSADLPPVGAYVLRNLNDSDHFAVMADLQMHPPVPELPERRASAAAPTGTSTSLLGVGALAN